MIISVKSVFNIQILRLFSLIVQYFTDVSHISHDQLIEHHLAADQLWKVFDIVNLTADDVVVKD